MTERSRGLPSPPEVVELLDEDFARAGYEIEHVTVDTATRPPRITVIADGDTPLDLDTVAELSRGASERLDAVPDIVDSYVLEVSSPGVERPLTAEKHFCRARGRKVEVALAGGDRVTGRIAGLADGVLRLVVRVTPRAPWSVREIAFGDVVEAIVQVEFSPPSPGELELVDQPAGTAGTEA